MLVLDCAGQQHLADWLRLRGPKDPPRPAPACQEPRAQIADRQLRAGARGLSVATISEGEAFARVGVDDLFIAYPVWLDADKAQRLRRLADDDVAVGAGVESVEGARQLGNGVHGSARLVEVLGRGRQREPPDRGAASRCC
ncbi:hypothetical protein [Streptomyces sp. 891-h]|uniref:hypothetical protein n=1 Tax=Streptomyces sp. 891-h TaxID=2720714 RepID=UPI001FA94312|nr:hypothetical protein [Streptomyces sp. 891-h]